MLKKFFAVTAIFLISSSALAQAPLPRADRNGDFSGNVGYEKWIAADSDPNGLNCRWSQAVPREWYSPSAKWPKRNISQWSVVRRFQKNTKLTANLTPAGFATVTDEAGKPWLKVSIGANDRICLVRANLTYVRPLAR